MTSKVIENIMEIIGYVGRYDNATGYMAWAGRPVGSIEEAKAQVADVMAMGVDVVEVLSKDGWEENDCEDGCVIASGDAQGWSECVA